MKKIFRTCLNVLLLIVLVFSLSASLVNAEESEEKVKLRIFAQYTDESERIPFDYAYNKMKEIMPNVELELIIDPRDDEKKIKAMAATGDLPDIMRVSQGLLSLFKKGNNLLKLNKYIEDTGIKDKLMDSTLSMMYDENGDSYAMPNVGQWFILTYYNKDLFEKYGIEPPENYEELIAAIKEFRKNDVLPLAIFAKEAWPGVALYDMIVSRENPAGIRALDKGTANISDEIYVKAAKKLRELVKAGLISEDAFYTNYDQALALFKNGKAAMFINGGWAMKDIGDSMGDSVGLLYYPYADADEAIESKWNFAGGGFNQGFAASSYTKYKDIVGKYTVLFSYYFAEGRVKELGDPNPIMKNPPKPKSGYNDLQKAFIKDSVNIKSITTMPWSVENAVLINALNENVNYLLTGDFTVEQFVNNIKLAIE